MRTVLVKASLLSLLAGCAATVQAAPAPAMGPPPPPAPIAAADAGKHPAYLHALADLRAARAHLAKPAGVVVSWDEHKAVGEIDAAIKEIKDAAIDDGKDVDDHPPVDVADWGGRLQKAKELLAKAKADVGEEEDNGFARGLRKRALGHIELAQRFVDEGIADARPRTDHPAYLHALTDLRAARGFLAKPAGVAVTWDEHVAIRQIDAAIKEIKDAAIDDGKDLDDHPPIDVADWGGRLEKARELLAKAKADIDQDEDNAFARGVRGRANEHLDLALRAVDDGIADARAAKAPGDQAGAHPAYMHALSDLREARALLARPADAVVRWDEQRAIKQIDAALKDIKDAAIDDGKDLDAHPPIDAAVPWHGRLQRALELVEKSAADIKEKETNDFAKGVRKRALDHLSKAARFVREGIDATR